MIIDYIHKVQTVAVPAAVRVRKRSEYCVKRHASQIQQGIISRMTQGGGDGGSRTIPLIIYKSFEIIPKLKTGKKTITRCVYQAPLTTSVYV